MEQLALLGSDVRCRDKMSNQGQRANRTGGNLEDLVYCAFKTRGYCVETQRTMGRNIYGGKHKVDLFVHGIHGYPNGLVIECKWQTEDGSVDEKFPCLVLNIKQLPCPAIVVIDGGGFKPGAIAWLKNQVDGQQFVDCFNLMEFTRWLNSI